MGETRQGGVKDNTQISRLNSNGWWYHLLRWKKWTKNIFGNKTKNSLLELELSAGHTGKDVQYVSGLKILLVIQNASLLAFRKGKTGPVISRIFPSWIQMQMGESYLCRYLRLYILGHLSVFFCFSYILLINNLWLHVYYCLDITN